MIWCRRTRKKTPEFRCETCQDAVKVQNQLLCGRPLDAPVEAAEPPKPSRGSPARATDARPARRSRRRRSRGVRMREKVKTPEGAKPATGA